MVAITEENITEIKNSLDKLINKFEINIDIISGLKKEAFIGGSTIVQAIMNVEWDNSDLDLFVKPDDVETVKNRLLSAGYFLNKSSDTLYVGMKVHKFGKYSIDTFPYGPLYDSMTGEKLVQKTRPRILKVDVIEVCSSYEDYFGSFDFDICTSRYNGKVFTIVNYDMAKKGITKIINNTCSIINTNEFDKIRKNQRVSKYKNRGITFI